jgi:hypothetical protein
MYSKCIWICKETVVTYLKFHYWHFPRGEVPKLIYHALALQYALNFTFSALNRSIKLFLTNNQNN